LFLAGRTSMNEPHIRPAASADIASITRIYADAVRDGTGTFEIEPPDEAEMARRHQALLADNFPYLVVEHAGAVAGYSYAGRYHVRPAYRWTLENSVYVAPQFQRLGLGRLLMRRLLVEAETRGYRQMLAVIGDQSNIASIALHASFGFRRIGTLQAVGFKHGRWLDVVLMQRPLGSANSNPP
jgi:L-amino acid N-acyltransferase YncA